MNLLSLQVGMPQVFGNDGAASVMDKKWETGFYKKPVQGFVHSSYSGLAGDGQADLKNHGGIDKAINVYPEEHFAYWKETLGIECEPGAFGENFTTRGCIESDVCIGDIFRIGDLTVQITQPRQPCWKLARRWRVKSLAALVQETGYTGWYFRVLTEGNVQAPDLFELLDRPHPEWTVAQANDIMHQKKNWALTAQLSSCSALSQSWQTTLKIRAEKQQNHSESSRMIGENTESKT